MQESHSKLMELYLSSQLFIAEGSGINIMSLSNALSNAGEVITYTDASPTWTWTPPILEPYYFGGCY